ncbi:MAG TPA: hypothetical protein VGF69_15285 [Thermoanaerobaculia bacterium]|jgi:hypothetical protein
MRRLLLITSVLLLATNAFAVAPQFWRIRSADEFLQGEITGFAVTSRGELRPAPAVRKLATFTDPFVLSQTSAPNGDRFFGTGNEGKIYRLRGTDLKVLFTAPEPEIYAVEFRGDSLYVASSPSGKIYRVNPESGAQTVFFDPKSAYIWDLEFLPNGDLAVATGVDGKLFRVTPQGEGKVVFDSTETHIRSVAARKDTILAGGSGQGRIYEVAASGSSHALYDSALNEISSIYVDANGIGWAAGVTNVLPSSAPAKAAAAKSTAQQGSGSSTQAGGEQKSAEASTGVEVSFSFDDGSSASSVSQAGTAELYRIDTDGFVEPVQKFEREMIYAVSGSANGGVLVSTGPTGRIYEYRNNEFSLVGSVPEKQIVSISNGVVTTTNSGAVYQIEQRPSTTAEFRSSAKDVERFSRFGNYRIEGRNLATGTVAISFRSGNTSTPDETWSAWTQPQTALDGNIGAPAGRYLQWKLTAPKPGTDLSVDNVTLAYVNRNVAPTIDAVTVQDPAVVFISSAYPAAPQVVEATNPDEYGIFSSLDTPRDRSQDPGKRMFRKGFRTLTWRARDENGDELRYSVFFRAKGTDRWLRLRENIEENQINFDTSQLPDGRYELRLVASDAEANPDLPLTSVKEGVEFLVDNTSPKVAVSNDGNNVVVRITDDLSPVGRVEYSADAEKWVRMTPDDGLADSGAETFHLEKKDVDGKFIIVRAVDSFYNVATENVGPR